MRLPALIALLAFTGAAPPALAEVALDKVQACLDTARGTGDAPASCIDQALSPCIDEPDDLNSVAILCFEEARKTFGDGIRARMAQIRDTARENIAAIAGIEVKYDLIASLTQCDRMEELARLGDSTAEKIQRRKSQCAAAASGLTWLRLVLRSADMPTKEN